MTHIVIDIFYDSIQETDISFLGTKEECFDYIVETLKKDLSPEEAEAHIEQMNDCGYCWVEDSWATIIRELPKVFIMKCGEKRM